MLYAIINPKTKKPLEETVVPTKNEHGTTAYLRKRGYRCVRVQLTVVE